MIRRSNEARNKGPGRSVPVRVDDTFLTSYPKSGNTWVRFLLANLIWPEGDTTFVNLDDRIPDIYQHPGQRIERSPSPRYLKSHEYFDPRYPRILYIVRDPRSVALSYFHHMRRIDRFTEPDGQERFIDCFLEGTLDPFGTWKDNVGSWMGPRGNDADRFLLVRYEDLLEQGVGELRRIAAFLGLDASDEHVEASYRLSDFTRMRQLEKQAGLGWRPNRWFRGGAFVRAGRKDEWKDALSPELRSRIEEAYSDLLARLGYR